MMAPPGMPNTAVTPSFSSERTTASAPVISGAEAGRAAGRGTAGAEQAVMSFLWCLSSRRSRVPCSAGGRALGGGAHESRILGEDATGIARGKGLPAGAAGVQLSLLDE